MTIEGGEQVGNEMLSVGKEVGNKWGSDSQVTIEGGEQAGIDVAVGIEEDACRDLNAGYVKSTLSGIPQVWLKAATSLDGRIADYRGSSKWITGEAARARGRSYRGRLDAILIGSQTLLSDDPALTTRLEGGRDPTPVILDTRLRCPAEARIFSSTVRPLIYCAEDAPERELPGEIIRVPRSVGGVDLDSVLRDLVARGVHNLLVEGGARIHRSFLDARHVDRLLLFLSPRILAGGPGFVAGDPIPLADAESWMFLKSEAVGDDLLLVLVPPSKESD